jgi:Secretion system C-terminal sorting domain
MKKLISFIFLGISLSGNGQCPWIYAPAVDSVKTNYFSSPPTIRVYGNAYYSGFDLSYVDSYLDANNVVSINIFWKYCVNGFIGTNTYYDITEDISFPHPQEFEIRINNIRDTMTAGTNSNGCITYDEIDTCLISTYFFPYGYNVSLSELTEESISVSPNPVKDRLKVQNFGNELIQSLVLMDMMGKELKRQRGNMGEMDVREFPSGTYFLQVETERGVWREKVMVH